MTGRPTSPGRALLRWLVAAVLAGAVASNAACGAPVDLSDAAAARLQAAVAMVRQAAADGRYDDALAGLDAIRADLATATASGDVSDERADVIGSALARTQQELDALVTAAAEQAAAEQAAAEQAAAEQAAAEQAAAEQAAAAAAAAQQAAGGDDEDKGRSGDAPGQSGNRGKGNDD